MFVGIKIKVVCDNVSKHREIEPTHGFSVYIEELGIAVDACSSREEFERNLSALGLPMPRRVLVTLDNPHHVGGASAREGDDAAPPLAQVRLINVGRERLVVVGEGTLISGCGLFSWALGVVPEALERAGISRVRTVIGGLGVTTVSRYLFEDLKRQLRALGVRRVYPLHTPIEVRRALIRELPNAYDVGAGSTIHAD